MPAEALLLLVFGGLIFLGLTVTLALRGRDARPSRRSGVHRRQSPAPRSDASRSGKRGAARETANPPPSEESASRRLSRRERDEMLDGVKNLARENPEQSAALIRNWLAADRDSSARND